MIGPLSYIGGKRRLAPLIVRLLPPHTTYVEPFVGGGQVFFHKPPSPVEILNDLDTEIVNFLRVCRSHPQELCRTLAFAVASRRLYELFQRQDPTALTDIERAARYLYILKNSFGSRVVGQSYRYCITKSPSYSPGTLPRIINQAAERLTRVQLENLPYEVVLDRFDNPSTVFYLDPPYVGLSLYRFNLADSDYVRLADRLRKLRGKFLLSINDCGLTRRLFEPFYRRSVSLTYTASRAAPTKSELLISNFPLDSDLNDPVHK